MQSALVPDPMPSDADSAVLSQVAALRETIRQRRDQAVSLWQACAPKAEETASAGRATLGRHTEQLQKGNADAD